MKQKAFTLAEIMVVLTVIGVLAGILVPIANHAKPDKNVMKFKKAHSTLMQVTRELVTSDKYYADGDLGLKPDGSKVNSATYLCETMADILSTKKVNCSDYVNDTQDSYNHYAMTWNTLSNLDNACKISAADVGEEIKLSDGVVIYQSSPGHHFQVRDSSDTMDLFYYKRCIENTEGFCSGALDDQYTVYKPICIDVDGIPNGGSNDCDDKKDVCPFGYGLRVDGKILLGPRAIEWLEKDIQQGK